MRSRSVGWGAHPALLLIDLINGFTDPASPLGSPCDDVVAANARLLTAFRDAALPVFYTTVEYSTPEQASVFRRKLPDLDMLVIGSHWTRVDERLAPRAADPVIRKQWASAFFGTDLAAQLERSNADALVVGGLTTSGCVRASAVDALQYNYPVRIAREATGDRDAAAHAANLHDLDKKYADVMALDELLRSLCGDAAVVKEF